MQSELPAIAKNIKKCRDKLGISQNKLSKLAGVTLHTLTKIETRATPDPRIKTLKKLQKY
jgi:predicted transcriptional regulator